MQELELEEIIINLCVFVVFFVLGCCCVYECCITSNTRLLEIWCNRSVTVCRSGNYIYIFYGVKRPFISNDHGHLSRAFVHIYLRVLDLKLLISQIIVTTITSQYAKHIHLLELSFTLLLRFRSEFRVSVMFFVDYVNY